MDHPLTCQWELRVNQVPVHRCQPHASRHQPAQRLRAPVHRPPWHGWQAGRYVAAASCQRRQAAFLAIAWRAAQGAGGPWRQAPSAQVARSAAVIHLLASAAARAALQRGRGQQQARHPHAATAATAAGQEVACIAAAFATVGCSPSRVEAIHPRFQLRHEAGLQGGAAAPHLFCELCQRAHGRELLPRQLVAAIQQHRHRQGPLLALLQALHAARHVHAGLRIGRRHRGHA